MKTAATTIFLPITKLGQNFFPRINKIEGKLIQAVTLFEQLYPLNGGNPFPVTSSESTYISLTEDGSDYFLDSVSCSLLSYILCKGKMLDINRKLSIENCFVNITDQSLIGSVMIFVVFYQDMRYAEGFSTESLYDNFSAKVVGTGSPYPVYMPDFKNLKNASFSNIFITLPNITANFDKGISLDDIPKIYVTFVKGSYAVLENIPLYFFYQTENYERTDFDGIIWDFENSYTTVAQGQTVAESYINFTVKYRR